MGTTTRKTTPPVEKVEAGLNIYEKLLKMRQEVLETSISKSGENVDIGFAYFELSDIIPVVQPILNKYKCLYMIDMGGETVKGVLINAEKPEEKLVFEFDNRSLTSKTRAMNELQALGAEITYKRRYAYMLLFELIEHDAIDSTESFQKSAKEASDPKPSAPATPEERAEIKAELTQSEEMSELQVNALKAMLEKILDYDADQQKLYDAVAQSTNNFTTMPSVGFEALATKLKNVIKGYAMKEQK